MVNMDETSVKLSPCPRKGWVVAGYREERLALLRQGDGSSLQDRRSAVSLVSFVADREEHGDGKLCNLWPSGCRSPTAG